MAKKKQVKKRKTIAAQRKKNPTNVKVAQDTISDYRRKQKKAIEDMFK